MNRYRPVDFLLENLKGIKKSGDQNSYTALCPAHNDSKPSLSVTESRDGKVLVHCFSGCGTDSVLKAVGLRYKDLFPHSQT